MSRNNYFSYFLINGETVMWSNELNSVHFVNVKLLLAILKVFVYGFKLRDNMFAYVTGLPFHVPQVSWSYFRQEEDG